MLNADRNLLRTLSDIYQIASQIQYNPTTRHQRIQKLCLSALDDVKKFQLVLDWISTLQIEPLQLQRLVENWSRYKRKKEINGPL